MHRAGADFASTRVNTLSISGWPPLLAQAKARADSVAPGLADFLAAELAALEKLWPRDLPRGIIHADLFPDNVLFLGEKVSGLIDFYFACTDFLAYDLAICLNAWCFESDFSFNVTKGRAMIDAYQRIRRLTPQESATLPVLARGAALRFTLTRFVDWLNVPPGALVKPKDPREYARRLRFHQQATSPARSRIGVLTGKVTIWTDGACSGNPGPGGWGAVLTFDERRKEICGGDAATTNNRMELTAAIRALEALTRPCDVDLYTDSAYLRGGITTWLDGLEKERLAHGRQEAGQKYRTLARTRNRRRTPQSSLALVEGPCRPSDERTRR